MTTGGRFGIAFGTAAVLMAALGVAVAMSYHPVRPRVLCAMPLGTGTMAVYFGYSNEAEEAVVEPLGPRNHVSPKGEPPTTFAPGSSGAYPQAAFVVNAPAGSEVEWTVGPRTARLDETTLRCDVPVMKPPPDDVAWIAPKPAVIEPVVEPEPPKPEPLPEPEPPKTEPEPPKPTPKLGDTAPKPRPDKAPPKADTPPPPVPLALTGLTNLPGGIAIQKGDYDNFGDAGREVTPENDRQPAPTGTLTGTQDGRGTEPAAPPKRVAAKVKSRPRGEWPADAPPRAGNVIVRLSLLVGEDGTVKQVKVVRGAGGAFDREAQAVGRRAVFTAATVDGKPVESWVPWDVEFTPDGD